MKSRRFIGHIILAITFLILVTAVGRAQTDPTPQPDDDLLIIKTPPKAMIDGIAPAAQDKNSANSLSIPLVLLAEEPADSCSEAPSLRVFPTNPADGGVANVSAATQAKDDPILSCMWGNPASPKGFRTVWYKLFAPVNGRVTIDTFGSNYDTVVGVYTGTCIVEDPDNPPPPLEPLQCNDDNNGFSSQVTFTISQGETYYIEVADREPGTPLPPVMQLSALLEPVNSKWSQVITSPGPGSPPNSRHAVVAQGQYLYVVGGQSGESGLPQISNRLQRFDAKTSKWFNLADIPGAGYSNTTAALVGNHIYLPSGYNGSEGYDGIHWAYTIDPNPEELGSWGTVASIPEPHGVPFAWASAAVPPSQNKYYLTGGLSSTNADIPPVLVEDKVVKDTFAYVIDQNTWIPQKKMQAGRYAHTSAWIEQNNRGICVAGGLGVQSDPDSGDLVTILHRSAECYQPGGNWHFIGDMNIPRYGAGSAVGPDGKWYVFGGMTTVANLLVPTSKTEVYDPVRNTWTVLDPSYNLGNLVVGNLVTNPARFWPRGAVLGNVLLVVGGSFFNENGEQATPIMERLTIPSHNNYIPISGGNYDDGTRPDDTFAQARPISLGIPQSRNFDQQTDFFDVYTFEIQSSTSIDVRLKVPDDNNFDVAVYGRQKTKWGDSNDSRNGWDEDLVINNLPPNRYYVVVTRKFPTGQPDKGAYYTLVVN